MLFDADNERLGLVAEYEHPIMGLMRQFGNTIDFSEDTARAAGTTAARRRGHAARSSRSSA